MQDAERFDVFVDRILAGDSYEAHDVPRRLRALVEIAALLASGRRHPG